MVDTPMYASFRWICLCLLMLCTSLASATSVTISLTGQDGQTLDKEIENNVRAYLSLHQQKDHPRLSDRWVMNLHRQAPAEIKKSLQALGYYQAEIASDLKQDADQWTAHFAIKPGPQLRYTASKLDIRGDAASDPIIQELITTLPLHEGDPVHHGVYESAKKQIQNLAARRGYFAAQFVEHAIAVDLETYSAALTLIFDSGERYQIGAIRFSESPIRESTLREYLNFEIGSPYLTADLINLQQDLTNTDYFDSVVVTPDRESGGTSVPIDVALTPAKRNRYTAGVGFGTDTGPRIKLGWQNRYINSRGHKAGADIKLSPVLSTLSSYYTIPHFLKRDGELSFNGIASRENTDTSESQGINLGLNYRHKRWGWDETVSLSYLFENFEIAGQEETSKLLIPGIAWSTTSTDDPTFTRSGYRLDLNLRGAISTFLSDLNFVQASLNAKAIHSFWDSGRFIVRGNLGLTETDDFDRMPTSLRYFAGGDNSIRGFGYEDLGPRDSDGDVIGGKYLLVGSFEYEHRIKDKWFVAGFVDAGNAFNKFGGEVEVGTGLGVRWLSPVGLIRVDVGVGISEPDRPIRLHIVIGPDL